jgi:polar amino acid transport system ATP-binding protein
MSERDVVLKVENLQKSYADHKVVNGISFEVGRGETKIICGPSGSGKSTVLRCLNLLARPDEGRVWLEGTEITDPSTDMNKIRQRIGFVFQEFNLFNHLNALRNVSIGLEKVRGIGKDEAKKIALEQLGAVGLEEHANKYPSELSGGQKQRVAIARALAMNPVIMFYDEPTSALDPQLIGEVLEVMKKLAKEKLTSLVVTHEMGFAQSVGDEMLFMVEGKIVERGAPQQLISHCQYETTKRFFERIQELYGREK